MIAHLAAFAGLVVPVGNIIAPLVIWLARRDTSAFVAGEAKEALNFNISVALAALVCGLLTLVSVGVLLGLALFIAWLSMTIIAAIKASEGIGYRYPVSLRLVK
ncbi:MAG: transrane protein [Gammaproteobacteria bacterium]|nr:transrane protein [Gammaproteobacteria bacterium]